MSRPRIRKHLDRHRQIATVLAEEGLFATVDALGLSKLVPARARARARGLVAGREPDSFTTEQHVRRALERLGPTFIKAGQAIATRIDVIPPELARELRKLQDDVPAEPFETVRGVIEADFGAPLEELFATFDPEPAAAASLGQVHWATLDDGTEVAVKVQRPDARRQVEIDIDIGLTQARWVSEHTDVFGDLDMIGITQEFADAVSDELDYIKEASNADRLWRVFRDDETVVFPRVFWEHSTGRVLTLERIRGVRMNRVDLLDEAGLDRSELARRGIRCYLRQMFEIGFFHADPHPGNYLALPDGRVGFTDFGRVGTITDESRERFVDLVWAAVNKDPRLATDTLIAVSGNQNVDEQELHREVTRLIGKYHGVELGRIAIGELMTETLGLIRGYRLGVPSDFALLLGTLVVLEGVGTMLDPSFDFASSAKPFADRVVADRMRPDAVLGRAVSSWRHAVRIIDQLPETADRMMRRLATGEATLNIKPTGYREILDDLHELVNRLAFALVVSALVVGFSTLLGQAGVPDWARTVGEVGLILAFGVTLWFFGSIILSHHRSRRRRK